MKLRSFKYCNLYFSICYTFWEIWYWKIFTCLRCYHHKTVSV